MADDDINRFGELLNDLFAQVDAEAFDRHEQGADKYGAFKFLGVDTIQEALEEVLDLINYARYTAVKLKLLQLAVSKETAAQVRTDTTGGGFISTHELFKGV